MKNVLGYEGRKVVITGAASGMGAAAARLLVELGAEVHALDIGEVTAPVAKAIRTDMKNKASIDAALAQLPGEIYALFNCAGVPHPPFSAFDTMMINFVGLKHLTDALLPRIGKGGAIASIASTAGMGWKANLELVRKFLALEGFDAAEAWLKDAPELNADAYGFSKQCLIVYTMTMAGELASRDVRINCISPSPTATAFMDQLTQQVPADAIKLFCPSNGRFAEPAEMGEALVLLNSRLAGFVSGLNVPVDYGYCAEVAMGQRDNLMGI
ncbi:MAG TPA: coniferyl-alcohol dehydrogenase [Pseudomonadales bacterium]|jgi:NAD(P)-dependent dehydrogenase (short-subunit alcohol dehydrogenase family)|nr:coniferyl-alcohol dehydrogenase [Pseudomonadales bacterium]